MSKRITKTTTTLTVVIEETVLPSSLFPAARVVVDCDGEEVTQAKPLAKCQPLSELLRRMG